ncbi:MAG: class I SAM-dependent methyltransferase [Acidobacteria bacterium]|nr:class I SAM-dependent methyltransferase [Acidobacteriota bacterium]MCK6683165.1 class I SAM-dependent methyltransferase [Thermoanaerobaculia bacterium]
MLESLTSWFRRSSGSRIRNGQGNRSAVLSTIVDEHFVPRFGLEIETYSRVGDIAAVHHLARYEWACAVLRSIESMSVVVDLGCGGGYGSFMLANRLSSVHVIGVDHDADAIASARGGFSLPNLQFCQLDVQSWRSAERAPVPRPDAFVCFDVIEHIPHREVFLMNVVEHMRDDGVLLLSTPCAASEDSFRPEWEFHKIEYSAPTLFDFLRRYFDDVKGSDEEGFPFREVFEAPQVSRVGYVLRLNPVICSRPLRIPNRYR